MKTKIYHATLSGGLNGNPCIDSGGQRRGQVLQPQKLQPRRLPAYPVHPQDAAFRHKSTWKVHGKLDEGGKPQRGNVFRTDDWVDIEDKIQRMVLSKNRRVLIIDDFQVVMQHEKHAAGLSNWLHKIHRNGRPYLANYHSSNSICPMIFAFTSSLTLKNRTESPDEDGRQDAE